MTSRGSHGDQGVWTEARIRALGTITDLATAARILRLSRSVAYDLARRDLFPVPVIRAGTRYRIPVAALLAVLHLDPQPGPRLEPGPGTSVDRPDAISSIGLLHTAEEDQR
jgi:hypothetical protein